MAYLLFRLLKDDLKEYTYAARLAGLVYGVASGMNAILVSKLFEVWRGVGVHFEAVTVCGNGSVFSACEVLCVCVNDFKESLPATAITNLMLFNCRIAEYSPHKLIY